jgi:hypothetical protein
MQSPIILTSQASGTNKAQIRQRLEAGLTPVYTLTCTESEFGAARNIVLKYYGEAAAGTVRQVTDATEIKALVGGFFDDPKRKQVFSVWTFNPRAR